MASDELPGTVQPINLRPASLPRLNPGYVAASLRRGVPKDKLLAKLSKSNGETPAYLGEQDERYGATDALSGARRLVAPYVLPASLLCPLANSRPVGGAE